MRGMYTPTRPPPPKRRGTVKIKRQARTELDRERRQTERASAVS